MKKAITLTIMIMIPANAAKVSTIMAREKRTKATLFLNAVSMIFSQRPTKKQAIFKKKILVRFFKAAAISVPPNPQKPI
jgi:uncharacterized paraquat-inducible protein A